MQPFVLGQIIGEDYRQEVQEFFAFATGFGVVFIDNEGRHIGPGSNFSRFCNGINACPEGAARCAGSNRQAMGIGLGTLQPCIYICHAGLINIEIPLIYEGQCVGALTAGQVLCEDDEGYPKDQPFDYSHWPEAETLRGYYTELPRRSRKQIEATAAALAGISSYILQKVAYGQIQADLAANREKLLLYEKQKLELENQLKRAQLDALQKQVTPHFIFNVINSVSRLISLSEYATAQEMLDSFAKMMRYSLSSVQPEVFLEQELGYIQNYLTIQRIRFGQAVRYEIECDARLHKLRIPFFSLQPLVENSLEHGLLSCQAGGRLRLCCTMEEGSCHIRLSDDGTGISPARLAQIRAECLSKNPAAPPREHIGLYNCFTRLSLLFGEGLSFDIQSQPGKGTAIHIVLSGVRGRQKIAVSGC